MKEVSIWKTLHSYPKNIKYFLHIKDQNSVLYQYLEKNKYFISHGDQYANMPNLNTFSQMANY